MTEPAQTNLQLYNQLMALGWPADDLRRVRAAYELAVRLFSGRYRCSGKPFIAHLVGTASVVADVGSRPDLVLAALLHAAYDQGDFGTGRRATQAARRSTVRSVVAPDAESLVFQYANTRWNSDVLARLPDHLALLDTGARDVLLMRLANEVDEHTDLGARYCDKGGHELYSESALETMAELSDSLDYPKLAATFRLVLDTEHGVTVPTELRSGMAIGTVSIVSASYAPRLSVSVRAIAKRCRRRIASIPGARRTMRFLRKRMPEARRGR